MRVAEARSTIGWHAWRVPELGHRLYIGYPRLPSSRHPGIKVICPRFTGYDLPRTPRPRRLLNHNVVKRTSGLSRSKTFSKQFIRST